jgi:hypothetical protein
MPSDATFIRLAARRASDFDSEESNAVAGGHSPENLPPENRVTLL